MNSTRHAKRPRASHIVHGSNPKPLALTNVMLHSLIPFLKCLTAPLRPDLDLPIPLGLVSSYEFRRGHTHIQSPAAPLAASNKHMREVTGKLLGYQGLDRGFGYPVLSKDRNQDNLGAPSSGCAYLLSGAVTPKVAIYAHPWECAIPRYRKKTPKFLFLFSFISF